MEGSLKLKDMDLYCVPGDRPGFYEYILNPEQYRFLMRVKNEAYFVMLLKKNKSK